MASYIKGDAVANATSYELAEKLSSGGYNKLAENSEINFNVSGLGLSVGDHTLVVKAKATGYEDSDYSNEIKYTVNEDGGSETTVDVTCVTEESHGEYNLATSSPGYIDSTNQYYSSSLYAPAGLYLTLPGGAKTIEMYYANNSANLTLAGLRANFFDASKTFISSVSGVSNSTAESGDPSYVADVPPNAAYMSYQVNKAYVSMHKVLVHCEV